MHDSVPDPDAHLRETTVRSEPVYRGHFLDVRRDEVTLPDGRTAHREYIVHPGAAMVVPLLDDGRLVVVRQWRHPHARAFLEFPAGKIDAGEQPLQCARRELAEETGYAAAEWARAGVLHNAIAYSDEGIEVWFARGLTAGAARPDEGEFLDVTTVRSEALDELARRGELTDAKTLVGLSWLHQWRAGAWPLAWQAGGVAVKVLDLCCAHRHRFEGWFASADDFEAQCARRLVTCPVCNDASITRLPSAPRLNRSRGVPDVAPAAAAPPPSAAPSRPAPEAAAQAAWLHAVRRVLRETEDVGDRFAAEARRIHNGEAQARGIRGRATSDEAEALREEGIAVSSVVLPEALKGPVH